MTIAAEYLKMLAILVVVTAVMLGLRVAVDVIQYRSQTEQVCEQ